MCIVVSDLLSVREYHSLIQLLAVYVYLPYFVVSDLLSVREYHSLIQLLCPDFPFQPVQKTARSVWKTLQWMGVESSLKLLGRCQGVIWISAGILLIWLLGTNFSKILIQIDISYIYIQENAFLNVISEMSAILSGPQCVSLPSRIILMEDAMDCLISFTDFLLAFQAQFYYDGQWP